MGFLLWKKPRGSDRRFIISRRWLVSMFCFPFCCHWFFNRGQQQINKVDWISHRKQHFGPKLAHPWNRLLCYFIPPLLTPSQPSCLPAFLSFIHLFINFYFACLLFLSFFPNCLLTFFLFFFPCPLVAVAMARHAKLSPSASCMTRPYAKVARALTEYYRGALYLTSYHLQFYT